MGRVRRHIRAGFDRAEAGDVVLTVDLVMVRYHLRDRRTARRLMDEAGSFRLGASLYVRLEDLIALEESRKVVRRTVTAAAPALPRQGAVGAGRRRLPPGWWRDGDLGSPTDR